MQVFHTKIDFTCPSCGQTSDTQVQLRNRLRNSEYGFVSDKTADYASEGSVCFWCPNPQCSEEFEGYAHCTASGCTISLVGTFLEIKGNPPMCSEEEEFDWEPNIPPKRP